MFSLFSKTCDNSSCALNDMALIQPPSPDAGGFLHRSSLGLNLNELN